MAKVVQVSYAKSFDFWSLYTWLKGRKRVAIAGAAMVLAYLISDQEVIALMSGIIVEGLYSIIDYYMNDVVVK
jgi:hypothetical protein